MMNELEKQIQKEILRTMTIFGAPEDPRARVQGLQDLNGASWDKLSQ
jgi:hypothetical protein